MRWPCGGSISLRGHRCEMKAVIENMRTYGAEAGFERRNPKGHLVAIHELLSKMQKKRA